MNFFKVRSRRCWFQRVSPSGPKKVARRLLSTPCISHPRLLKYSHTDEPISPLDPVTMIFIAFPFYVIYAIYSSLLPFHKPVAQYQNIHLRPQETIQCFFGLAYDRLVFIKRSIEQNRNAGHSSELFNQLPVDRIVFPSYGLQPARAVHMSYSRYYFPFFRFNLLHFKHERIRVIRLKILPHGFNMDRRRKRPE